MKMDNNNQMHQCCWNYIIIITIIYFQNTVYEFGLDTFQYFFKLIFSTSNNN